MLRRLEELSNINGVSGDEGKVRRYIKEAIKDIPNVQMRTDTMGNLIVHKKGQGPKVMLAAHMDEVGMLVLGVLDNGLIAYSQRGLDPRVVVSKRVVIGDDMVEGVIGAKAIHLQTREEMKAALAHSELFVDIGAKDKDDALKYVKPGDHIAFTTRFKRLGESKVLGKALDDRIGCAVLMELIKNTYECDFYAVFTVQEELGLRGAMAAVYAVQPDAALILEGTVANDTPDADDASYATKLGAGVAITFMDRATIVNPNMFKLLAATAKEANIKWQPRQTTSGANDAGPIHQACAGCVAGSLAVPCRYIHSPASIADINDINSMYALADAFLKNKKFNEVL